MIRRTALAELLWWTPRVHWGLPLLFLWAYSGVSPSLLLAAAGAWTAGAVMDRFGSPRESLSRIGSPLVALFFAASAADLLFGSRDLLASVSFLLLGVQSIRLLLPKRVRDGWQLCAISLVEFLAAAASTDELSFAAAAFLFLLTSAGAMWSLHERESGEKGKPAGGYEPPARLAAWVLLLAGFGGFAAAAILFTAVPRLEFRRGFQKLLRAQGVTGFSDTVALREVTGLKADRRVVARIEFPSIPGSPARTDLYLRGAVYPRYDSGVWSVRGGTALPVRRAGFAYLLGETPASDLTVADIALEPADDSRLLLYGHPVSLEGSIGPLRMDGDRNLAMPQPGHPALRYRLRFATVLPPRPGAPGPGAVFLEFPEGLEDVRALGERLAGTGGGDAERADRLLRFFRSGFRYTLTDPAPSLRTFLFERRAGFCEHYAAALALLLRAGGIPSRVAAGYLGGEWNGIGQYLIVRRSDAHAWVEAWIDGRWVTFDATPPAGEESPFSRKTGPIGLYVDWLRQRWDKYVVNYSLGMQAQAVSGGWTAARKAGRMFRYGGGAEWTPGARRAAAAAGLAAVALFLLRRALRRGKAAGHAPGRRARLPAPYARLVARLERSGFRPSPGAPMEEMIGAAVASRPDLAEDAARFLPLYHRDRFGPVPLTPPLREEAFRRAESLRTGLSTRAERVVE
ncbi:MAG: DUF3488 domain-containing protein [Deltaproteobacteria bacterium]|nr:MAG: DUF3488 domain-containing protein [Deltaproteobacteria bacterium]